MGIATGAAVPDGADAVIPLEYVVDHDNKVEIADRVEEGANIRPRAGDLRAGDVVVRRGSGSGQPSSARSPPPASPTSRVQGDRAPPCSRPAVSCAVLERRWSPARSTRRTASCSGRNSSRLEPWSSSSRRWPTTRQRIGPPSSTGSKRLAGDVGASPSAPMTSSGRSVPSSGSRRSSGASPSSPESRSGSACGTGRSSSGCPATRCRHSCASELFVRPAVLALQRASEQLPSFEPGRLARGACARTQFERSSCGRGRESSTVASSSRSDGPGFA